MQLLNYNNLTIFYTYCLYTKDAYSSTLYSVYICHVLIFSCIRKYYFDDESLKEHHAIKSKSKKNEYNDSVNYIASST